MLSLSLDSDGRVWELHPDSTDVARWACGHGDPRLYATAVEGRTDAVAEFVSNSRDTVVSALATVEVGGLTISRLGGLASELTLVVMINGSSYDVASLCSCYVRKCIVSDLVKVIVIRLNYLHLLVVIDGGPFTGIYFMTALTGRYAYIV